MSEEKKDVLLCFKNVASPEGGSPSIDDVAKAFNISASDINPEVGVTDYDGDSGVEYMIKVSEDLAEKIRSGNEDKVVGVYTTDGHSIAPKAA